MQTSWGGLNYTKETMCTMLEHQTLKTKPASFETKVKLFHNVSRNIIKPKNNAIL